MKVVGLWLKYMFVGIFLLIAAVGSADVHGLEESGQTRWRTRIVSGVCGIFLAAFALGLYLLRADDSGADPDAVRPFVFAAGSLFAATTLVSWWMISSDLRARTAKR